MDITKIDPNFLAGSKITREGLVWRSALEAPFRIHGLAVAREDVFSRLPEELLPSLGEGLRHLSMHTAGGRVRFRTNSAHIALRILPKFPGMMSHMPLTGSAGVDVLVNGVFENTFRPENDKGDWYEGECARDPSNANVELGLPLYNGVRQVLIGLDKDAYLLPPVDYNVSKPVVYYGSSITQGGCASKPGNSYEGFLSRWLDADHINLGFSGNAKGELEIANYIASLSMSVFVMDYDHNAPSVEHLKNTHEAFFQTIRRAQPLLPVIFMTKPDWWKAKDVSRERRKVVYDTYMHAKLAGDERVMFVDGRELFGACDYDSCTMDGTHPNDLGFYRMACALLPYLKRALSE